MREQIKAAKSACEKDEIEKMPIPGDDLKNYIRTKRNKLWRQQWQRVTNN